MRDFKMESDMKDKSDFNAITDNVNQVLLSSKTITSFPFSIIAFVYEMTDCELQTFSELEAIAINVNQSNLKGQDIVCSEDAALIYLNGRYVIFYNDKMSEKRIRFSIIHECAHYFLGHNLLLLEKLRISNPQKANELYLKYEQEANFFAAEVLVPEGILVELSSRGKKITIDFITETFGVSKQAAEIRLKNFRKLYNFIKTKNKDDLFLNENVLEKFKLFINNIAPNKKSYIKELEDELEMEKMRQSWY